MKKQWLFLLCLFLAHAILSAQEDPIAQNTGKELDYIDRTTQCQFDTTDFSEVIHLYNALTGEPNGEVIYKRGNYYMNYNGTLRKLTRNDLLKMFSMEEFSEYKQAKNCWNASIPLFVVAGCAGGLIVGGTAWFLYGWSHIMTTTWEGDFSNMPTFKGALCVVTGIIVGTATLIPAIHLNQKGNSVMGGLAYDYNYNQRSYDDNHNDDNNNSTPSSGKRPASNTSMHLIIGGTSQGFGLTLRF